ncbi:Peroxisomal membrane protein PEX17 [Sphaceloma murrayae]|uniref:Peroxisomal membrane protein PEX17 n=1 Tax=Sphaceloma murrayae TaxID=2082308 RepID=A0A2K1QQV9_9PEZI|nr:Peroxisomal membrane protein PEX17 [Sphaceloma murrayae]
MPADRLLSTLLRALQAYTEQQDTLSLLGAAASLLTGLNNPLNVTLLIGQTLSAPALWTRPDGLRFCLSFMGVFHSAVKRVHHGDIEEAERKANNKNSYYLPPEPRISLGNWVRAVIAGADERSPSSRHLLLFGGILIGLGHDDNELIPAMIKNLLQEAFVKAVNQSLHDRNEDELGRHAVVLSVNHAFPFLSDFERSCIDYDELLPHLMNSLLHSSEGLRSGYFLQVIDSDIRQATGTHFTWAQTSQSFQQNQRMLGTPLIASIGPLSRLIAHAAENTRDPWLVSSMIDDIAEFSTNMHKSWRQNKLSEIDVTEEDQYLSVEARQTTLPELWRLLRSTLFALVIILRSGVGRLLADRTLGSDAVAPQIASQSLRSLHDLNFIFSRLSSSAFSQYTFVHLTCIDVLNAYPAAASTFLRSVAPTEAGKIPQHPLDRTSDLFFLNTAEHFTLCVRSEDAEALFLNAAAPYLTATPTPELIPIFEAAHSVMLAVFSAPHNAQIASRHLPFYVDALFRVFPQNLTARQFRLAFRNLVKVVSPPGAIAQQEPMLAGILLDLVHERAVHAPSIPLPPSALNGPQAQASGQPLSEQAVLVLTLLDALPFVEIGLLEEWLPMLPDIIGRVHDTNMREECVKHLWEMMAGGGMDSERSQVCVGWWTTGGGMEAAVHSSRQAVAQYAMAGALPSPGNDAKL